MDICNYYSDAPSSGAGVMGGGALNGDPLCFNILVAWAVLWLQLL